MQKFLVGILFLSCAQALHSGLSQVRLTVTTEQRSVSFDLFTAQNAIITAAACGTLYAFYKVGQSQALHRAYLEKLKVQQLLLDACNQDNQFLFEEALRAGASIIMPFPDGQTILMKAAVASCLWLVQRLMFLCVDSVAKDTLGKCAIDYALAASKQNQEIIRLINHRTTKMLWEAMLYRTAADMQMAIDAGANVNEADSGGFTILCNTLIKFYGIDHAKIEALTSAGACKLTDLKDENIDDIVSHNFPQKNKAEIVAYIKQTLKTNN